MTDLQLPAPRSARFTAVLALLTLFLLSAASCGTASTPPGSDQNAMNAVSEQLQSTLASRGDVVKASVNYQNNLDASAQAHVAVTVKPGTDFEPVIDAILRLVWQSKLNPLRTIRVDVVDEADVTNAVVRHIDAVNQKADLDAKFGTRPQ